MGQIILSMLVLQILPMIFIFHMVNHVPLSVYLPTKTLYNIL